MGRQSQSSRARLADFTPTRYLSRRMRWMLFIVLLNGLVPSLAEAIELGAHFAETGHLAHFEDADGDLPAPGTDEHGCGPTSHHCGCCVSQSVLVTETAPMPGSLLAQAEPFARMSWALEGSTAPPQRPPIR